MSDPIAARATAQTADSFRTKSGWTSFGICGLLLLVGATAVLAVRGARDAAKFLRSGNSADNSAGLIVYAADGDSVSVWLDREGQPGRALPQAAQIPPGKVALRITRRVGNAKYRSDIIRLELRPGLQHLIAVGDGPIQGGAYDRSTRCAFASHFLPPGPLAFNDRTQTLDLMDSVSAPHALEAGHPVYFDDADGTITTADHALLLVNPYSDVVECVVSTDQWSHEISLPGPICHVIAVGSATNLHVTTRLAPGNQPIDDCTIDLPSGLGLYTVGGRTVYRWTSDDSSASAALIAPKGLISALPAGANVTLSSDPQSDHWILSIDGGQSAPAHLAIVGSVAILPPRPQPLGDLTIHPQVQLTEISVPHLASDVPVTAIATDGKSIIGVCNAMACDLSTGKPLHEKADFGVSRLAIGNFGLVLLTDDGALAAIRDGVLVRGPTVDRPNPSVHIVPVQGDESKVWLFRDDRPELLCRRLDSQAVEAFTIGPQNPTTDPSDASPPPAAGITALTPIDNDLLVARDRRIDRMTRDEVSPVWQVHPVVILPPAQDEPIVGVVEIAGRLIFSTRQTIYTLQGDTVLPLVDGIGGPLYNWRDGILVHDVRSLRIFQITGAPLQQADAKSEGTP